METATATATATATTASNIMAAEIGVDLDSGHNAHDMAKAVLALADETGWAFAEGGALVTVTEVYANSLGGVAVAGHYTRPASKFNGRKFVSHAANLRPSRYGAGVDIAPEVFGEVLAAARERGAC